MKTMTKIEINFTSQELCAALEQYVLPQIKDKIGHIVSKGIAPVFYIYVRESDNSAQLQVTITDNQPWKNNQQPNRSHPRYIQYGRVGGRQRNCFRWAIHKKNYTRFIPDTFHPDKAIEYRIRMLWVGQQSQQVKPVSDWTKVTPETMPEERIRILCCSKIDTVKLCYWSEDDNALSLTEQDWFITMLPIGCLYRQTPKQLIESYERQNNWKGIKQITWKP